MVDESIGFWQLVNCGGGRRKPLYGEPMKRSTFKLPPFMRDWLKEQPGGMSETVRRLVRERMEVNND